jgi:hypothetical protein
MTGQQPDIAAARHLVDQAGTDPVSRAARVSVCGALAAAFQTTGERLWPLGYMLGTDRGDGESPFGFGNDATVGLAIVAEIAGELISGTIALLDGGSLYGAAALLRQLVEVEYLCWAFAEDEDEAKRWMRSDRDERLRTWQPKHLRERSGGRFRGADYQGHCERGGHPTPEATTLLAAHSRQVPPELLRLDLAHHGVSAWRYALDATQRLGYLDISRGAADKHELTDAITRWEREDRLRTTASEMRSSFGDAGGA